MSDEDRHLGMQAAWQSAAGSEGAVAEQMTNEEAIKANAERVLSFARQQNPDMTYGEDGVAWLDGYIERVRLDPSLREGIDRLAMVLGSFLGECIRTGFGGTWAYIDGVLGIEFSPNGAAFPFAKTQKQLASGHAAGESVLSLYRSLPEVIPALRK
jgi:hypothetical protein